MIYQNLTDHDITLLTKQGTFEVLPRSPLAARIRTSTSKNGSLEVRTFHRTENVPPPKADTFYVVPTLVALFLPARLDLVVPVTQKVATQIITTSFCRVQKEEPPDA